MVAKNAPPLNPSAKRRRKPPVGDVARYTKRRAKAAATPAEKVPMSTKVTKRPRPLATISAVGTAPVPNSPSWSASPWIRSTTTASASMPMRSDVAADRKSPMAALRSSRRRMDARRPAARDRTDDAYADDSFCTDESSSSSSCAKLSSAATASVSWATPVTDVACGAPSNGSFSASASLARATPARAPAVVGLSPLPSPSSASCFASTLCSHERRPAISRAPTRKPTTRHAAWGHVCRRRRATMGPSKVALMVYRSMPMAKRRTAQRNRLRCREGPKETQSRPVARADAVLATMTAATKTVRLGEPSSTA
mmetsp:Transcript_524/g.1598  ORF Transcript_524/g.1598 Transcript_524/m.1598 type:complete len:311 (+) Transcript_524:1542-2474(+)